MDFIGSAISCGLDASVDTILRNVTNEHQMRTKKNLTNEGKLYYKKLIDTFYKIFTMKEYTVSYKNENTMCLWNILMNFPNIVSHQNANIIISTYYRLQGILSTTKNNKEKLNIIDLISYNAFIKLLPFTGANMVI